MRNTDTGAGAVMNMWPTREWLLEQIKKKFWDRLAWLSFISIIALLGDEVIKEGYILNPADLTNPFAHELWIVILAVMSIVSAYISKRGGGKDGFGKSI